MAEMVLRKKGSKTKFVSIMPFWEVAAPIIGQIAGSGVDYSVSNRKLKQQRQWALDDRDFSNVYNSPKAQIQRLRAANLPLAAMMNGSAGSQSADPRGTTIQPQLNTADTISKGAQFSIQRQQAQMLEAQRALVDAQTRNQNAEADIKEGERNYFLNPSSGDPLRTNQYDQMDSIRRQQSSLATIKSHESSIREVESAFNQSMYYGGEMSAKFREELRNLVSRTDLNIQEKDFNSVFNGMKQQKLAADIKNVLKQNKILDQNYQLTDEFKGLRYHQLQLEVDKLYKTNSLLKQQYDLNEVHNFLDRAFKDGFDKDGGPSWSEAFFLKLFAPRGGVRIPGIN